MSIVLPHDRYGRPFAVRVRRPGDRRNVTRSAVRTIDVMEFFGEARRPLRAIEIARRLNLHSSTADQLLKSLVDSAHLNFDARTMTYRPSPRLVGFSGWMLDVYGDDWLRSLVCEVAAATGLTTTLTIPNDVFMQVIDVAGPVDLLVERGQRISMFGSATGSAYLSTLPRVDVEWLANRARIAADEVRRIVDGLTKILHEGFADGSVTPADIAQNPAGVGPIWSIAVPIPQGRLPFSSVIGLAGLAEQLLARRESLQKTLRDAVARVARGDS